MATNVIASSEQAEEDQNESSGPFFIDDFDRLYHEHCWMVEQTLFRFGFQAHDRDDLMQDIFLRAFQHYGQLRDKKAEAAWIRAIAERMATNWFRRRKQSRFFLNGDSQWIEDDAELPESALIRREMQMHVMNLLPFLREMDQETLHHFYLQGRSVKEMSSRAAAPIDTIKRRLHVARKRLKKLVVEFFPEYEQ